MKPKAKSGRTLGTVEIEDGVDIVPMLASRQQSDAV